MAQCARIWLAMDLNTATICYVRSLVPVVAAAGLPEARFLDRLGIDRTLLDDIDARVPKDAVAMAWEIAATVTQNQSVGLMASTHAEPGSFPVLDHIAANAPTVGHALRLIARYCRLCDPELVMQFDTITQGGAISLVFPRRGGKYSRHWPEWFIGLILSRARRLSQDETLRPLWVTFQHEPPTDEAALRQILGVDARFSAASTSIAFSHAQLAQPVRFASAFLSRIVLAQAERDLAAMGLGDTFTRLVRRLLIENLSRETPTLQSVARQAHCSSRTLQLRLKREDTSFARLLDEARQHMALQYIENSAIRLMEIPLLLNYADPSPFHRAFKRWTGKTPLEYRRTHQDDAARAYGTM